MSAAISARADAGAAAAGAADEQQRAAGAHLAGGVAGDGERQPQVLVDLAARLGRSRCRPAASSTGRCR